MDISSLLGAMPGAMAQGLIWGIMAIGVFITFRIMGKRKRWKVPPTRR